MEIKINNIDFWDSFEAMKYWSFPKNYDKTKKYNETKAMIMSDKYIGSRKVDGIWGMIIKDNDGNFHLRSRTPNVEGGFTDKAEWVPQIIEELTAIPNGTVLLGEIYRKGDEGSRRTTAIINCLKDKSLERQKEAPLSFYCFDCLAYGGKTLLSLSIKDRIYLYLEKKIKKIVSGNYIDIAEYKSGEELWNLLGQLLDDGYEGVVIQHRTNSYTCGKRQARLTLKIKKEINQTIDAFLDGGYKLPTKEYNGKAIELWEFWYNDKTGERYNKNMYFNYQKGEPLIPITKAYYYNWAAAVSFSVMKDGVPVHIGYISGIPDSLKQGIIEHNEDYVGQVYELNAMEIENIDGNYSLRHGKIVGERFDKRPEDCVFDQIANN